MFVDDESCYRMMNYYHCWLYNLIMVQMIHDYIKCWWFIFVETGSWLVIIDIDESCLIVIVLNGTPELCKAAVDHPKRLTRSFMIDLPQEHLKNFTSSHPMSAISNPVLMISAHPGNCNPRLLLVLLLAVFFGYTHGATSPDRRSLASRYPLFCINFSIQTIRSRHVKLLSAY